MRITSEEGGGRQQPGAESRGPASWREAGLGLTETLIALVIFSTAMLGIAGTAARVGALMNAAHVRLAAVSTAGRQVELLLSKPPALVSSGSAEQDGVAMSWVVTEGNRTKEILLVYRYEIPGGVVEDTLTAAMLKP
jgi:Tfp pilus assembly protein PilV